MGQRTSWTTPKAMQKYLSPTDLCDSNNPEIKRKAQELIKGSSNPRTAAVKIFYYVRDHISFAMDNFNIKASDTLKRGGGHIGKTNLQVALLRAAGIPARYRRAIIKKDYMKGLIPDFAFKRLPDEQWWHCWCECYLSGQWVSCDVLFDEPLYEAMWRKDIVSKEQIPTIDWDGKKDLDTTSFWQVTYIGTVNSIDDAFKKAQKEASPSRIMKPIIFRYSNRQLDKARNESQPT